MLISFVPTDQKLNGVCFVLVLNEKIAFVLICFVLFDQKLNIICFVLVLNDNIHFVLVCFVLTDQKTKCYLFWFSTKTNENKSHSVSFCT